MGIKIWNIGNRSALSGDPARMAVFLSRLMEIFLFLDSEMGNLLRVNDSCLRISSYLFLDVLVYCNRFCEKINRLSNDDPCGKTGIVYFNSVLCKEGLGG